MQGEMLKRLRKHLTVSDVKITDANGGARLFRVVFCLFRHKPRV